MGCHITRSLQLLALAFTGTVIVAPAFGQSKAPTPSLLAPKEDAPAKAESPGRTRSLSPAVAAQLAAVAPKYTPPPPKPEPKPEEEEVDARDVDKPRNNIIRLPKYIVQEAKPPVFNERAIHTKEGLTDIAVRRYISDIDRALNRFTLPLFSSWSTGGGSSIEKRAMAMYAEQERLDNINDLTDTAATVSKSDAAQGAYILRESQQTYLRTTDFGWQSRDPAKR